MALDGRVQDVDRGSRTRVGPAWPAGRSDTVAMAPDAKPGGPTTVGSPSAGGGSKPDSNNPNGEPMVYVAAPGHGSGCGHCTGQARYAPKSKALQMKAARNAENLAKVWAHEMAHASKAGRLGGAASVTQDPETGATKGEVPVAIPGVNKKQPEQSIQDAETVIAAAMAPQDPSGQDYAVAGMGASLRSQAQAALAEKNSRPGGGGKPGMAGGPERPPLGLNA